MTDKIKELRQAKNLSRERLAHLCGLTGQTIYRAEKTGRITLKNYEKIIKALHNYDTTTNDISNN